MGDETKIVVVELDWLLKEIDRILKIAVNTENESQWLTKQELARYLKVSLTTIDEWRRNKGFPVRWAGDKPRFHKKEVDNGCAVIKSNEKPIG